MGLKGMILHRLGKRPEALELLNQSLTRNSEQALFLAERGAVLEALGQRRKP